MKRPLTIVGGGIVGCIAALKAAQAGYTVTLYEAKTLGAGASGQALGLLVPSTATRPLDMLQVQGCALWAHGLAAEISILAGVPLSQLYRTFPRGAQLNLAVMFPALEKALLALGVAIHYAPAPAHLAGPVLWAAGWGNKAWLPAMNIRAGLACQLHSCGVTEILVGSGTATQGLYAAPLWDGTVVLGTHSFTLKAPHTGPVPPEMLAILRTRAADLHPALATAPIVKTWVGNRPASVPRLPLIRAVASQHMAVAGLGGIGYALAPVVAAMWLERLPTH
jgi:glycine/D-amino acid oxidase-like deaminating enzyme